MTNPEAVRALIDEMRSAVQLSAQFSTPVADRQCVRGWADQLEAALAPLDVSDPKAVRALIEQWRENTHPWPSGQALLLQCADELEAAILTPPTEPQGEESAAVAEDFGWPQTRKGPSIKGKMGARRTRPAFYVGDGEEARPDPPADETAALRVLKNVKDYWDGMFVGDYCPCCRAPTSECEHRADCIYNAVDQALYALKMDAAAARSLPEEQIAVCLDCGLPYADFQLDLLLPRAQWLEIHPDEGGLLCAQCIVRRAAKVPRATAVHAVIEIAPPLEG